MWKHGYQMSFLLRNPGRVNTKIAQNTYSRKLYLAEKSSVCRIIHIGRDLRRSLLHPCSKQGQLWGLTRLLRALPPWVLKKFRDGACPSSPGSLYLCLPSDLPVLTGERFQYPAWTVLLFVHACCTLLPCHAWLWRDRLSPLHPRSHLCPMLENPYCPGHGPVLQHWALQEWTYSLLLVSFLHWGAPNRPWHPDVAEQRVHGRGDSPSSWLCSCCCNPGCCWPSLLPELTVGFRSSPWNTSVKSLAEVQVNGIHCSLFIRKCSHFSAEVNQAG